MYNTIDNTHNRILDKISIVRKSLTELICERTKCEQHLDDAKRAKALALIQSIPLNVLSSDLECLENEYMLSIAHVLSEYYSRENCPDATRKYYRVIASENIIGRANNIIYLCNGAAKKLLNLVAMRALGPKDSDELEDALGFITADLDCAATIEIAEYIEHRNIDICKCGSRLQLVPEISELRCDICLRTKKIVGSVLHYDQSHDGQKSKHNEYDVVRHLRFHLEHLQALESKTFDKATMEKISYVISRDGIIKTDLSCEIMRSILKDPYVNASHLNNHAPLLVKTFGGNGPPTFDYDELKILRTRFIRTINVHTELNPFGGNNPYYPHFIHKIAEVQFADNPEKLRILEFIHLQSPDTVEKNDQYFADVCNAVNDPSSGLIYTPTDPSGRF
jgi:Poxvirus Late Transcription Factor VLTF3 like